MSEIVAACCREMFVFLSDSEFGMEYNRKYRSFSFSRLPKGYSFKNENSSGFRIRNCPKCGRLLPADLYDEWRETIKSELGLTIVWGDEKEARFISKEFFSDEWWIKRFENFKDKKVLSEVAVLLKRKKEFLDDDEDLSEEEKEERFKNYKYGLIEDFKNLGESCCFSMRGIVENAKAGGCDGSYCKRPIFYDEKMRVFRLLNMTMHEFLLGPVDRRKRRILMFDIYFCPWCGKKFPKSLSREWYEIVSKDFGVTNILDKKKLAKVPKEFMTDKWWKDRGL